MSAEQEPRFAVRISRGLVTHGVNGPLLTWDEAEACRKTILDYTGEQGQIEKVVLSVAPKD